MKIYLFVRILLKGNFDSLRSARPPPPNLKKITFLHKLFTFKDPSSSCQRSQTFLLKLQKSQNPKQSLFIVFLKVFPSISTFYLAKVIDVKKQTSAVQSPEIIRKIHEIATISCSGNAVKAASCFVVYDLKQQLR
jgi:hypothetical protein